MNPLLIIIFILYILMRSTELLLTRLNMKHLAEHGLKIPPGFENHVRQDTLRTIRNYTIKQEKLDVASSITDTIITVIFVFGGMLDLYNSWVQSHGLSNILSGTIFFLLLSWAGILIKIPFDLYSTFHIEQEFGFNKQSASLWIKDFFKSFILSTFLTIILLAACFWLIENHPHSWWFLVWLFFFVFSVFLLYISPYVIEPLFNKFSPIENDQLEASIKKIMTRAGIAVTRIFTMDASKRSTHVNAYFTGIGHVKRIVLFDTLLEKNTPEELMAILAHEAGHWKKKHILKRLVVIEIFALLMLYAAFLVSGTDMIPDLFGITQSSFPVKLFLIGFTGSILFFPLKPISNMISRKHENDADDFAVKLISKPEFLVTALIKLGKDNLSNLHPHPLFAGFYYSHPPLQERIKRINSIRHETF